MCADGSQQAILQSDHQCHLNISLFPETLWKPFCQYFGGISNPQVQRPSLELQEGCVHPGWRDVLPCQTSIAAIYEALEQGNLDLPLQYAPEGPTEPLSLRQLAELPLQAVFGRLTQSARACANALTFMQADGDACHLSMLRHTGMP